MILAPALSVRRVRWARAAIRGDRAILKWLFKITKDLPLDGPGCFLMDKTTVNGDGAHPVFKLGQEAFPGDIAWNFAGIFLFDGDGTCVGRYDSKALKEGQRRAQGLDSCLNRPLVAMLSHA